MFYVLHILHLIEHSRVDLSCRICGNYVYVLCWTKEKKKGGRSGKTNEYAYPFFHNALPILRPVVSPYFPNIHEKTCVGTSRSTQTPPSQFLQVPHGTGLTGSDDDSSDESHPCRRLFRSLNPGRFPRHRYNLRK